MNRKTITCILVLLTIIVTGCVSAEEMVGHINCSNFARDNIRGFDLIKFHDDDANNTIYMTYYGLAAVPDHE